jgi:hypothetical protein
MRRKPLADRTLEKLAAAQAAGVSIRQLARNRSSAERQEIEQLVAEWLHNGTITERGYTHRGEPCYVLAQAAPAAPALSTGTRPCEQGACNLAGAVVRYALLDARDSSEVGQEARLWLQQAGLDWQRWQHLIGRHSR